jgi:preprotein translocase subunit SecB
MSLRPSYPEPTFSGISNLSDVRLTEVQAKLQSTSAAQLRASIQQKFGAEHNDGLLVCSVSTEVVVTDAADDSPVYTVALTIAAAFDVLPGAKLSKTNLKLFATTHGLKAIQPYVRETLQSLTVRAGLPAFILPPEHAATMRESTPTVRPGKGTSTAKKIATAKSTIASKRHPATAQVAKGKRTGGQVLKKRASGDTAQRKGTTNR